MSNFEPDLALMALVADLPVGGKTEKTDYLPLKECLPLHWLSLEYVLLSVKCRFDKEKKRHHMCQMLFFVGAGVNNAYYHFVI